MRKKLSKKVECEVCGNKEISILQRHHIKERTEIDSNNHDMNLAIICANCHSLVHSGKLKIIGLFPSTKPPNGRTLIYELNNISNIKGITESYFTPKAPSIKIHKGKKNEER